MQVYVVLSKGDCETIAQAVFHDRKEAEKYLIKNAVIELDNEMVEKEDRHCHYDDDGNLIDICDNWNFNVDWWIDTAKIY